MKPCLDEESSDLPAHRRSVCDEEDPNPAFLGHSQMLFRRGGSVVGSLGGTGVS